MNDLFLRACFGKPVERTPTWIMRQAGRYLPEYREVRAKHDFWTVCRTPELATTVTIQPIDRLGVDAAILFSDILVPLPPMGCAVEFRPAPAIAEPIRTAADVNALVVPDVEKDLAYVLGAIRQIRRELGGRVPLIGFGGAPATLAAYMVQGGGGKFEAFRALLYENPRAAERLFERLVETQIAFLGAQIDAGAQAVQIFDSWGGILPRDVYERFELPAVRRLVDGIRRPGVPIIYYNRDAAHVHDLLAKTGADVLSIDEKTPLDVADRRIDKGPAFQGNLDNTMLGAGQDVIERGVRAVLERAPKDRGHVFNLGHGILPHTPPENALFLVEAVKRLSRREGARTEEGSG